VFFIWGGACTAAFVFVYLFVPETKGLSLEQVDLLIQKSTPMKSDAYRRRILSDNLNALDDEGHEIVHAARSLPDIPEEKQSSTLIEEA